MESSDEDARRRARDAGPRRAGSESPAAAPRRGRCRRSDPYRARARARAYSKRRVKGARAPVPSSRPLRRRLRPIRRGAPSSPPAIVLHALLSTPDGRPSPQLPTPGRRQPSCSSPTNIFGGAGGASLCVAPGPALCDSDSHVPCHMLWTAAASPPPPLQPTTPSKQLGTRYLRRGAPRPAQPDIAGGPAQKGPVDSNWPFNVIGDAAVWHLWLLQVYGKHMAGAVRWSLWRRASFGL